MVKCEASPTSRVEMCEKIARDNPGFKIVPSSDDVDVIAGQGTIALELHEQVSQSELAKKVSPRLRDSACWRSGEITQPRTHFFGQLCTEIEQLTSRLGNVDAKVG